MLTRPESDETHTPVATPVALGLLTLVGTDEDPYKKGGPWVALFYKFM